jgi:hypothetical protein
MKRNQTKQKTKKIKEIKVTKTPKKHYNANGKWDEAMDENLELLFFRKVSVKDLSIMFGRTPAAIRSRIRKLNLREKSVNSLKFFISGMLIIQNEFSDIINFI